MLSKGVLRMKRLFLSLFAGALAVSAHAADTRSVEKLNALSNGSVVFTKDNGKLVATITDTARVFNISEDVVVDEVRMERVFAANKNATVVLPFEIDTTKIVGGQVRRLQTVENGKAVFSPEYVGKAFAYAPYLLELKGNATKLEFSGPVKLIATTPENTSSEKAWINPCANNGGWQVIGTIALKGWTANGVYKDEIGSVYGFMGKDLSGTDASNTVEGVNELHVGDFVKIKSAKIQAMRAYLKYDPSACPVKQGKPAAPGAAYAPEAPATTVYSIDDLPETMKVIIRNPVSEGGDEDDVTAIKSLKPVAAPKADVWHDAAGRSMNAPKAHGVYLNDRTPVIVK